MEGKENADDRNLNNSESSDLPQVATNEIDESGLLILADKQ